MTTRRLWILLALAACGAPTPPPAPAPEPVPAPAPAPVPADASAPTGSAGDEGAVCGTRGAKECPANQFCNYPVGADCGATDRPGRCATKPQLCPHLVNPVCGCDGKTYNNGCEASRSGTGLKANGACAPG